MRLLKAEDHRRMPWKNGGGETVEIVVHPPETGLGGFDWRVSMATVAADGPFSPFPGIDRTLALLDGEGMDLAVEGHGSHRLTPGSPPLAFPGDAPAAARLVAGAITDLNVMTRRIACRQRVTRLRGTVPPFAAGGRWIILVAVAPSAVMVDGRTVSLGGRDALLLEGGATIAGDGILDLVVIEIDPVGPS
ncbi:HutD/Ves family protein [Methylobacterium aquaticum]|uniref:HutD/Ves family protein n=1 Tax=Methylobacterium aquaticum TaxID=270351 RepID=UPI001934A569|nr:HutD family protein [Methylobacterium aquaticum]QRE77109.1 HutD family protein [Methylobacterium aquaticum]